MGTKLFGRNNSGVLKSRTEINAINVRSQEKINGKKVINAVRSGQAKGRYVVTGELLK